MDASRTRLGAVGMTALAVVCASASVVLALRVPAAASAQDTPPAPIAAPAQTGPRFVEPGVLPQGERFGQWGATAARAGLPKTAGFCLGGMFKAEETSHRAYRGSAPKVSAQQYVVQSPSETAATALVAKLGKRLETCYKDWLNLEIRAYEDAPRAASWERYRTSRVEDGLTAYGVFTVPPKGFERATHLYGVGRDGDRVMVLHMSLVGSQTEAPHDSFRDSAARALRVIR